MRLMQWTIALLFVCGIATSAVANEQPVSVQAGFDIYSQYEWRGLTLDNISAQPNANFGFGESGVSFNFWSYFAAEDREIMNFQDRLDFSLKYDRSFPAGEQAMGLTVGYTQYAYLNTLEGQDSHSEEIFAGLSLDHLVAPKVMAYYDFNLLDGMYVQGSVNPKFPLNADGNLKLGINASVAASDYAESFGFNDAKLLASLDIAAGPVSIVPTAGVVYSADEIKLTEDNHQFWGGLGIKYNGWR